MDLISIIVPVYNVESYLGECIDSICSQTYQNLEIILVDDGSTDNCPKMCDDYALKDSRIKVIHQSNRGLSAARNEGYRVSNGQYIAFVDSDDIISDIYIETLHTLITTYDAQIAVCAYTRTIHELRAKTAAQDYVLTSQKMLKEWHGRCKNLETIAWNKLYHRQIFENFNNCKIFPERKTHEDIYTSHLFVDHANMIAITTQKLYYYRMRENSISRVCSKSAAKADLDAQRARLDFFRERKLYRAYMRLLKGHMLHRVMYIGKFWINK